MNYLRAGLLDALAREYAVGTLAGGARRRFERLLRDEAPVRQAVAAWQARLDTLAATVPSRRPSPAVWAGLEARLFSPSVATPAAALAPPWWRRLLGTPALAGALAGVMLAVVVLRQQPDWAGLEPAQEALPQSYVGLLQDGGGQAVLLASSRRHGRTITLKMLQPLEVPASRTAVLWALPKSGAAPFAVGPVPPRGSATLPLPAEAEKLFFNVGRLAVSFEPTPGAAAPSGEFVLSGHCAKLW